MNSHINLGTDAILFISAYLCSLLFIGWLGKKARQEHSLSDHFLGGKSLGLFALAMTLFATQYSGNTLLGFAGKAYRVGYFWIVSILFMTAVVAFYLTYAPKLYALSKKHNFITPSDYLKHRFQSNTLSVLVTIIMVIALSNYVLAQMLAMGRISETILGIDPQTAFILGIAILSVIMIAYDTLGGFRAVVWTDILQGTALLIGFIILLVLILNQFGGVGEATQVILANPEIAAKAEPPEGEDIRRWFSYIVLVGIGAAFYPQAIQRIYSAKSEKTLRNSLKVMAFMPLITTLTAFIVGIIALAHISKEQLGGLHSDDVLLVMLGQVSSESLLGYWVVVLIIGAALAALMSTFDSGLLSISSMMSKDLYGGVIHKNATDAHLTHVGKTLSWIMILALALLAINLRDQSLVKLLVIKFQILIQVAPAFILGLHWKRVEKNAVLAGLISGSAVALAMTFTSYSTYIGIHAGVWGLIINVFMVITLTLMLKKPT